MRFFKTSDAKDRVNRNGNFADGGRLLFSVSGALAEFPGAAACGAADETRKRLRIPEPAFLCNVGDGMVGSLEQVLGAGAAAVENLAAGRILQITVKQHAQAGTGNPEFFAERINAERGSERF